MEDREQIIKEKLIAEEYEEMLYLTNLKQTVREMLIKEKGYHPEEIEIDHEFTLQLSNCETTVSIDFVINFSSVTFMIIKCTSSALESYERYIIAFARAIKDYQIPYAVITDGKKARVIDVINTALLGQSIEEIFSRDEAIRRLRDFKKIPYPPKRIEKEKRIVYAFEGIKCPTLNPKE